MITVKQLTHLRAVIQHGTIHGAAENLHLTHPALTRSLNSLEETLGIKLFDRSKSGMSPTDFCLQITEHCHQVLLDIDEIKRRADHYRDIIKGELNIAVGKAHKGIILRETLPKFHAMYPHIPVSISEGTPEELAQRLKNRELDMLIAGRGSYNEVKGLTYTSLGVISFKLLARKQHPLSRSNPVESHELLDYPMIAPTQIGKSHPLFKMVEKKIKNLTDNPVQWPTIICNDYPTLRNILIETDAWLIGPMTEFSESLDCGELIELSLGESIFNTDLAVMESSNRSRSPAANIFIEICQDHFDNRVM